MIWREEYALGIEALDKQHQGLFIAVNSLNDLLKTSNKRRSQRACFEALKYLENYTVVHFKDEEEYQRSIGYINYAQHKRQHDAFLKTISYTKLDLTQSDFSDASIKRFVGVLTSWLLYHITNSDQSIVGKTTHFSDASSMSRMLQNVMLKVTEDMFHIDPEVADGNYEGDFSDGDLFCVLDFSSDEQEGGYRFILALEEYLALRTVGSIVGETLDKIDELVTSAIEELANVLILQVLTLFHNTDTFEGKQIKMIQPQEVWRYSLQEKPECSVLFSSNMGSFAVRAWRK